MMFSDIKITTTMLYQGALFFALMDVVYIPLLVWRIKEETFGSLKWTLVVSAALIWFGIWSWAIGNFWDDVYSYVFPPWARTWVPWIALFAAGLVALVLRVISIHSKGNPVFNYCLLGGLLGSLTHIWAVHRGIVTKPPMLQGASPLGRLSSRFLNISFIGV